MKMKKKIPDIISEEDLKKLLKMEIHFTGMCYSCPLYDLATKNRTSCVRVMQCICGNCQFGGPMLIEVK